MTTRTIPASYAKVGIAAGGEAGRQRPSSPGERERSEAERPGRHVLEVRDRKRREERPERERDQRGRPETGRDPLRDPADEEDADQERDAARKQPDGPEPHALGRPQHRWRHAQGGGAGQLEHRHPGCLVRVEVAVAARPVEGEGRVEAAVRAHPEVDERSRQAEPRDVLRVDRIDRRQRRDGDQGEEQKLPARPAPGKRRRRSPDELHRARPQRACETTDGRGRARPGRRTRRRPLGPG